jgi:hypothetical protein
MKPPARSALEPLVALRTNCSIRVRAACSVSRGSGSTDPGEQPIEVPDQAALLADPQLLDVADLDIPPPPILREVGG